MQVMKQFKVSKTAHCGYIYSDGHVVILHKQRHPKAGEVAWVEIIERIDALCRFDGRIVFHDAGRDVRFQMAVNAVELRASLPSVENGSDNTRKRGLRLCSFTIGFKDGTELYWNRMPDLISDGLTHQPEHAEVFDPNWGQSEYFWGDTRINKIHRMPAKIEVAA